MKAYFDESERQSGLLCVGGYIFADEQAKKLTKQFRTAFGQYGGFHMADLLGKRKGFKGITDRQRDLMIREAVQIVRSRFSYGVAVTVNRQEYESQAPRWIRGFRDAYPFLCHLAILAAGIIARKHSDTERIEYVFESGHAHAGEARHVLTQMSESPELCAKSL